MEIAMGMVKENHNGWVGHIYNRGNQLRALLNLSDIDNIWIVKN